MTLNGRLHIIKGQAFVIPDANQPIITETLMMMKDVPPGGTPAERIDAAPSFFEDVLDKHSGDPIVVTGVLRPFGAGTILILN
jgi:hypothetical protein